MTIRFILVGDHLLLEIQEDILLDNSKEFYKDFEWIFQNHSEGISRVSLDFRNVRFLDSSGIGIIISIFKKVKSMQKDLLLVNLNKTLDSVFRLSGLESILEKRSLSDFLDEFPEFRDYMDKR